MMKKREEEAVSGTLDSYGNDFFGLLLKAYHDPDKTKKISVDDLIDECKTIYVAGQETTTSLLSWTLLLLSIYQDWQDKARQEVSELIGGERNPNPESIAKLKTVSKSWFQKSAQIFTIFVPFWHLVQLTIKLMLSPV